DVRVHVDRAERELGCVGRIPDGQGVVSGAAVRDPDDDVGRARAVPAWDERAAIHGLAEGEDRRVARLGPAGSGARVDRLEVAGNWLGDVCGDRSVGTPAPG